MVVLLAVVTLVVLLVHVVSVLLGVLVSLEPVNLIHALALGELVDLGADKAHQGLLGESVLDGLAYTENTIRMMSSLYADMHGLLLLSLTLLALVVLVGLHAGKGSGTGNELVRELALVLLAAVHLAVSVVRFA